MEYTIRQLEDADYDTLVDWWNYYSFPPPAKEFLPDNGECGMMIVDENGVEYCAGFIYETNSKACLIELIVANPDIKDKEIRKETLIKLINDLTYLAYDWGYRWIFTSVKHPSLIQRYVECGFQVGTEGSTEMIKQL